MNYTFDWNDWFMIITGIASLSLFFLIRKYFHPVINISIWIYNVFLVETIDYFLVGTPYQLYYFSDNPTYEPSSAFFHLTVYPASALIFLYVYDKWEIKGRKSVLYILFWTCFSILFEWVCIKNNVLTYTGWKLLYSVPTYPIAAILLICFFRFIQKHMNDPLPR
ncbi:CBO0543 family protein [Peribacillus acanthi]|uniref:CBO0543 family protein n=1 Tax=Peribacillus acanthi TaxID=2171554 RepID=UPI000D3E1166|nr:CBO0543 family protein [Peribacillus acanthi]